MKRVIIPFLVKQLVLVGILFLALDFFPDFSIDGQRSGEDRTIKIGKGDKPSGKLELTPAGKPPVHARKKVIWSIKSGSASNVQSFEIKTKSTSENVFESDPPRGDREHPGIGILKDVADTVDYEYAIIWYDESGGGPYTHDPKIAVMPYRPLLELLIYIIYALFAALITFLTFRKK